jgi:hypothetical protein
MDPSEIPFGGDADTNGSAGQTKAGRNEISALPRMVSSAALGLAFLTATLVVVLRLIHCFRPGLLPIPLKSAVPLILIGLSCLALQLGRRRALRQRLLGLGVAAAFILWGIEQYLSNHALAAAIDDAVVFLFVLDLSVMIRGQLNLWRK